MAKETPVGQINVCAFSSDVLHAALAARVDSLQTESQQAKNAAASLAAQSMEGLSGMELHSSYMEFVSTILHDESERSILGSQICYLLEVATAREKEARNLTIMQTGLQPGTVYYLSVDEVKEYGLG